MDDAQVSGRNGGQFTDPVCNATVSKSELVRVTGLTAACRTEVAVGEETSADPATSHAADKVFVSATLGEHIITTPAQP